MTAAMFATVPMVVVDVWTGAHAQALRTALRMTNEGFAERLGTAVRTVAKWNATPQMVPVPELQRVLDTALSQAPIEVKQRFLLLTNPTAYQGTTSDVRQAA